VSSLVPAQPAAVLPYQEADEPGSVLVVRPRRGGVGPFAARTIAELRGNGWGVDELALSNDGASTRVALAAAVSHRREIARADVLHVEFGSLDLAPYWFAVLASRRRPLVVVAHDAPRIALAPGTGLIGTGARWRDVVGHRFLSPALDGVLARRFARKAAVAVVLSERARLAWTCDAPPRIVVADHGADPPTPGRRPPSEGRYALFAGYVGPGKGIDTLLEAWDLIAAPNRLPLLIAGTSTGGIDDISYEARLRDLSSRLPAPPIWLGFVADDEFARLVAEAAVVVAPYRRSNPASGLLVRAMVEGRAVVATRVPAALDCLEDGVSGLLVDPDDPQALAQALERVMADSALRDRLGAAAASSAATRFTWPRYIERLTYAYRLAIGRG
jgi:glycosyltransferase involved in cell wall biosynthesis